MLPDDIYLLFYSSTLIELHLGGLRRKQETRCVQPCRFRDGFTRDSRDCSQKCGSENVRYPKVHLTVLIK